MGAVFDSSSETAVNKSNMTIVQNRLRTGAGAEVSLRSTIRRGIRYLVARAGRGEGPESLRVFGCLPVTGARGCTKAGVRKASREETAGEFAPTLGVGLWGICRRCLI